MNQTTSLDVEKAPPAEARGQNRAAVRKTVSSPEAKSGGFDFRQFRHSVREKLWIIVLCVVAGVFLALGYLARTPKMYQGHVVMEVDVQQASLLGSADESSRMRDMFLASQDAMRTIEQSFTNRTLLARVIRSEGLSEDGGRKLLGDKLFQKVKREAAEFETGSPIPAPPASESVATAKQVFSPLEEALAGYLAKMVSAKIRRGTRLIDVAVIHEDPGLAQRLTEAVAREYIRNSVERRTATGQETLGYLFEEEERLKANLKKSEAAVAEYKAKTPDALQLGGGAASTGNQTANSGGGRGGIVEDKLQDLTTKLTSAKAERLQLEGELKQIEAVGNDVDKLLAFPRITSSPTVADRRRDVAEAEAAVSALAQRYKDKHPKMISAHAALNQARENLRRTVLSQPAVLKNAIEQARAAEANLTAAVGEQEKAALALNKAAIGYQELARQSETDRALYENVLKQIKETNVTKDAKTDAVSIVEHSPFPRRAVSPSPARAIALGLMLGVFAGIGFVFMSDAMDRSIKTVDQAESALKLPVLAAIPEVKRGDSPQKLAEADDGGSTYRLVAEAPEGPAAESFRNLRAALSLLGPEVDRKVFIFTSASPEEGKSFTSANYALSLAQQGHRVLLIDGDLRRPTLHKIFRPGSEAAQRNRSEPLGIVDYMVGGADLKSVIREVSSSRLGPVIPKTSAGNGQTDHVGAGELWLMAGGRRAPNPAELLSGSTAFSKLVDEARMEFDRVIIDSAPVLAVSDTLVMTPHVQSVCLVVRAARTPRNAVQRALGLLETAGAHPVGVVLNRLPRRGGSEYYYYYASHGYGEGEGSYTDYYRPTLVERRERTVRETVPAEKSNGSKVGRSDRNLS
jgi:succinoglycan biosynthesis transport protein ExoP